VSDRNLTNVAASVHDRLLNRARETERSFNELLQYWAIERFLFRLAQTPHAKEDFVLKGALLLQARGAATGRPTRDIDLLRRGGPAEAEHLVEVVRACCRVDVADDGMRFDPESIEAEQISRDAEYEGVRIRFRGYLGNARAPMQLDVGVGDALVPGPVAVEYPELLDYGKPRLRGYTLESLIAEKFQVLVSWAEANTRMKDFYDLASLAGRFPFDGARIAGALSATFERRGTPPACERRRARAWPGVLRGPGDTSAVGSIPSKSAARRGSAVLFRRGGPAALLGRAYPRQGVRPHRGVSPATVGSAGCWGPLRERMDTRWAMARSGHRRSAKLLKPATTQSGAKRQPTQPLCLCTSRTDNRL
jgi:hypothetical protein